MAKTQQRLQYEGEEVKVGQVTKFLQCLDAILTENRNILTALPELHKRFVELEANMAKGAATVASDNTGDTGYVMNNLLLQQIFIEGTQYAHP